MTKKKNIRYELRHVIDTRQPYINILVETYHDFMQAHDEAQILRKQSPGIYLIKKITTEIVYVSKLKGAE